MKKYIFIIFLLFGYCVKSQVQFKHIEDFGDQQQIKGKPEETLYKINGKYYSFLKNSGLPKPNLEILIDKKLNTFIYDLSTNKGLIPKWINKKFVYKKLLTIEVV